MLQLTMDIKTSAEILGLETDKFLEFLEHENFEGIIKLQDNWRISIFTIARILSTKPDVLLEILEDYWLGQMMENVEDDERFDKQTALNVYHSYLEEA